MQTGDDWWSDAEACTIPGPVGTFPFSYSSFNVCGGPAAITQLPLVVQSSGAPDVSPGTELGQVYIFREYGTTLRVTVVLGVAAGGRSVLFEQPGQGEQLPACVAALQVTPTVG